MLESDSRIPVLIDWLMARYEPLDYDYKMACTFSLGFMMMSYGYELADSKYYRLCVKGLEDYEMKPELRSSIPSVVFMLPCFAIDDETSVGIGSILERLSSEYFVYERERIDLLVA